MNIFDKFLSLFNRSENATTKEDVTIINKDIIILKEPEAIAEENEVLEDNIFEYPKYHYNKEKQCFYYSQLDSSHGLKDAKREVFSFAFADSESPFTVEIKLETLFLILKETNAEAYITFFGKNICEMVMPILKKRKVCTGFVKVENKKTYFKKYEEDDYELFDDIMDTDPFFDIEDYSTQKPKKKS